MSTVDVIDLSGWGVSFAPTRARNPAYEPLNAQLFNDLKVASVVWWAGGCKVTFNQTTVDNSALRDASKYIITPHAPVVDPRASLKVLSVTPEAVTTPTYVILATEEQTDGQLYNVDISALDEAVDA